MTGMTLVIYKLQTVWLCTFLQLFCAAFGLTKCSANADTLKIIIYLQESPPTDGAARNATTLISNQQTITHFKTFPPTHEPAHSSATDDNTELLQTLWQNSLDDGKKRVCQLEVAVDIDSVADLDPIFKSKIKKIITITRKKKHLSQIVNVIEKNS